MHSIIINCSEIIYSCCIVTVIFIALFISYLYIARIPISIDIIHSIHFIIIISIIVSKIAFTYYCEQAYLFRKYFKYLNIILLSCTLITGIISIDNIHSSQAIINCLFLIISSIFCIQYYVPTELTSFYREKEIEAKQAKKETMATWNTRNKSLDKLYHHSQNRTITEEMMNSQLSELEKNLESKQWHINNSNELKYIQNNILPIMIKLLYLVLSIHIFDYFVYPIQNIPKYYYIFVYFIGCYIFNGNAISS